MRRLIPSNVRVIIPAVKETGPSSVNFFAVSTKGTTVKRIENKLNHAALLGLDSSSGGMVRPTT